MEPNLNLFYGLSFLTAVLAFAFAAYLYVWVKKQRTVNKRIIEVSGLIKEGAKTFMSREYKVLAIFAVVVAAILLVLMPTPIWKKDADILNNVMIRCFLHRRCNSFRNCRKNWYHGCCTVQRPLR